MIDGVRPDVVAASFPLLGCLMAAEVRRIPCAALVPNVVSLPAEGMPPFGTGWLPPKGVLGRARDRAANALVDRLWNKGLPELNRIRTSLGLRPLDAPHRSVLAHADVLVTHGGHGTVMKALVAGVPIVGIPTGRDQPDNAARLTHRGAGIKISRTASPATIARAIQRVLDDPSFRTAAGRLGEQLRVEADSGAAVTELEALAGTALRTGS